MEVTPVEAPGAAVSGPGAGRQAGSLVRLAARLARTHRLLVVCGYDGTLAPLAGPGSEALPVPEAVVALRALAELRGTHVAVVSHRPLRDLAALSRLPAEVRLIGRDGREVELGATPLIEPDAITALRTETSATAVVHIRHETAAAPAEGVAELRVAVGADGVDRIADPTAVARFLAVLAEERRGWVTGGPSIPIERLTMLGNRRTVALVTPSASVTWLCCPMPDSPAVFASLLGGPDAGHFSVFPDGVGRPLAQRYLPGTMTVETRWSGLKVTDYLSHDTPPHRTDLIRVIEGNRRVRLEFAPRPEFGHVPVRLAAEADGLRLLDTVDPVVLRAPGIEWEIHCEDGFDRALAWVQPTWDKPIVLELRYGSNDLSADPKPEPARRQRAGEHWSRWRENLRLPALRADLAGRSALTLRALCHRDHGGILAAATTSLPEEIGGVRNWDYRYCWIRDGALTAKCLVSLGSREEAERFLAWLRRVLSTVDGPERLHPLYTIAGTVLGPEATLEGLPGYAASRPVRIGNLAEQQVQLDVFGPVADLVAELAEAQGELRDAEWDMVLAMAAAVERRWHEPDHGIWEERTRPRHRVYSKVMCWLTIDRLVSLAARFDRDVDPAWSRLRDRIAEDVLTRGWHPERRSFTTAYGDADLDAAVLHVGLSGLLPADDPRFAATVNAVEAELRRGPTVYRYLHEDGLPGGEGGFHLCTAWLIEAYLRVGRIDDAEELFKHLADAAGPTGLLPEEYDPVGERSLGNHPQAYSHLGLVRCAQLLSERC
jgi:GH15 family glucan-1,4-alpha-glucosidase